MLLMSSVRNCDALKDGIFFDFLIFDKKTHKNKGPVLKKNPVQLEAFVPSSPHLTVFLQYLKESENVLKYVLYPPSLPCFAVTSVPSHKQPIALVYLRPWRAPSVKKAAFRRGCRMLAAQRPPACCRQLVHGSLWGQVWQPCPPTAVFSYTATNLLWSFTTLPWRPVCGEPSSPTRLENRRGCG